MATKSWKSHEKTVADFFFTTRMGHKPREDNETPSDVVVHVKDWLVALGKNKSHEPWKTFIIECKYRRKDQDTAAWLRKFWKFYDGIPSSVDTNLQIPMMLFKERWGIVRLGHWLGTYRALFASGATNEKWVGQIMQYFFIRHTNLAAPAYFGEWLKGIGDVDTDTYGRTLPMLCLGSSIARKGDGGGKVIIFSVDSGISP